MMVRLVGIILFVGSLGSLALWTAAPVKVFFSEIPDGVFGKWLVKTNEEGNPTNALLVQRNYCDDFSCHSSIRNWKYG